MTGAFDREAFDRAVSEFRLEEAERILHAADPATRDELDAALERGRDRATEAAQELYRRITDLGTADDHVGVLSLYRQAGTEDLLGFLSESHRRRVEVYVQVATRWETSQGKVNQRRLAEARRVLETFDIQLARGLVARVDERFLDEEGAAERDRLLLDIEARAMEMNSLTETAQQLTKRPGRERPPWWRRWRR